MRSKYGKTFKFYIGLDMNVMLCEPARIDQIFNSTVIINKSKYYDMLKPWLGDGLLISGGKKWKQRRKLITPSFHFKILENFVNVFNSAGGVLIDQLSKEVGKESVDIYEILNLYTLDVICETAMGVQINAQTEKFTPYATAVRKFCEMVVYRVFHPLGWNDTVFRMFSSEYKSYNESVTLLHDVTRKVIKTRKALYANQASDNNREDDFGRKKTFALLDLLLTTADAKDLTDEDIEEEINTFIFEGHDTTSAALAFILYELSKNSSVQSKLYEEIIEHFGHTMTSNLTIKDISDLKYLDMVCKEGLRMYPSVPFVMRKVEEEFVLDGITIPRDTILTVLIFMLHYDPDIYPNPEEFIPERFSVENQMKRGPYDYVPFSAGARNCVGQKFAIYEIKTTIIKIIQKFEVLPAPDYKKVLGFMAVLKPKNGVEVRLKLRDNEHGIGSN
ncbi:cytochrome P450 4d2-like [Cylas formicarius]|uniref:cytochrome P450 4d2-like n=1 Tax=Cylas formicarius TaxID=197179 RepID=UPI002958687B|nr:cytochrome P450 4d2-like [Cylas formicarius]